MRSIRASELGTYLFCRRAWWYRLRGVQPANTDALQAGSRLHSRHGNSVLQAGLLRLLGLLILLAALGLAVAYCTVELLP